MKKVLSTVLVALTIAFFTGCTRVEPGYVGIKVNMAGDSKGVEDYPLQTGWVFYNPITSRVYDYPTFQQNVIWCASLAEGKTADESISFNCKGGAAVTADVSMSGKFVNTEISHVFVKFRAEPTIIVHGYLRNEVRDALGRVASTYDPMDIIGDKRGEFLDAVKKEVKSRVGTWWDVDYITFANKLKVDDRIENAINLIIAQKQQTAAAELKVKQTKAEADQVVAKAEGEQRAAIEKAKGEAESIRVKAKAQSDANELIRKSLSPEVLQSIALDKWDGVLPTVTGGNTIPFINVSTPTK